MLLLLCSHLELVELRALHVEDVEVMLCCCCAVVVVLSP